MLERLRKFVLIAVNPQEASHLLDPVRTKISEAVLLLIAIFSVPVLGASLIRGLEIGWHWYMLLHISSAILIWYIYLVRHRISFRLKATVIVALCVAISYSGFLSLGLQSSATPLLLLASSLAIFLFPPALGLSITIFTTIPVFFIAYFISHKLITISVDPAEYNTLFSAWSTYILVYLLALTAALTAISIATKYLLSLLATAHEHEAFLQRSVEEKTYRLREKEQRLSEALRMTNVGSWFLDLKKNEVTWSSTLYDMFRLDPNLPAPQFEQQKQLFTQESWDSLNLAMKHLLDTGTPYELDLEIIRFDGSHGWMLAHGEEAIDIHGNRFGIQGTAQDITERKKNEIRLAERASLDPLTKVFNRVKFEAELQLLMQDPETNINFIRLFLIDLDSFKKINDLHGHASGDAALIRVANALKENTNEKDLIGRLGGDEFLVLFHHLPDDHIKNKAQAILQSISSPMHLRDDQIVLHASIGVSAPPSRKTTFAEMLEIADDQLYTTKRAGGNSFSIV